MKDNFFTTVMSLISVTVSLAFVYALYLFIKKFSYWLFYEDMVKVTIMEVLKSQGLN